MVKIAVIGSCSIDLTVEAGKRPAAGETIIGSRLIVSPGGKGANQAVAAARLGAQVHMIGCVGDDAYGTMIINNLKTNNVDTGYVSVLPGQNSGTAHITLAEGDNSIIVIKGANDLVMPKHIDTAWNVIAAADLVMLQHEIPLPTIDYIICKCAAAGISVLLNPAPVQPVPSEWLDKVTYVTPNEHEAEALYPGKTSEEILLMQEERFFMTLGKAGVAYAKNGKVHTVPAFVVNAQDTTGAGDTFNSAFAVARCEGRSLDDSIRFANAAAALSVQKLGAQGGMPYLKDVERMLGECKK